MNLCRNGHDRDVTGRNERGECNVCRVEGQRRRRAGYKGVPHPKLPSAPLFDYMDRHHLSIRQYGETTARRLQRWKAAEFVSTHSLDSFIGEELQEHPTTIYGPSFYDDLEEGA